MKEFFLIWEGLSEGTQNLRVLFSQTLCPPNQQQGQSFTCLKPRRRLVFCEEVFFILKCKDWQVLGEVEDWGGGHFPFCYPLPSPQDMLVNLR